MPRFISSMIILLTLSGCNLGSFDWDSIVGSINGRGVATQISDSFAITAAHVVRNADPEKSIISFANGDRVKTISFRISETEDVALIEIESRNADVPHVLCARPSVGNLALSMVQILHDVGWVVTESRIIGFINSPDGVDGLLQMAVMPGFSGGPMYDRHDRIIGMIAEARLIPMPPSPFFPFPRTQFSGYSGFVPGDVICDSDVWKSLERPQ